jgi:hypothetical protein
MSTINIALVGSGIFARENHLVRPLSGRSRDSNNRPNQLLTQCSHQSKPAPP